MVAEDRWRGVPIGWEGRGRGTTSGRLGGGAGGREAPDAAQAAETESLWVSLNSLNSKVA